MPSDSASSVPIGSVADFCETAQRCAELVVGEVRAVDASNAEVVRYADDAAAVAATGVELAEATTATFSELAARTDEIGEVIQLIDSVASDTQLLALNATIEAAHAGAAGSGFAVVASEVKQLSAQTAKATQEVAERVAAIQQTAGRSIEAMQKIVAVVGQIGDIQGQIATEIRRQDGMTETIHSQVDGVTEALREISEQLASSDGF